MISSNGTDFFVDLESLIIVTILFVHVDNITMYYSDNELVVKVCVSQWGMIRFEFEQNIFFLVDNRQNKNVIIMSFDSFGSVQHNLCAK